MKIAREKAEADKDTVEKTNLDKQILAKTEERDKIIEKQRETWQGCIDIVEEMNPNLVGTINKYNGEILSNADLQAQKGLQYMQENYNGLEQVTHDGWYKIKNEVDGSIEDCYMTVDENTGKITAVYNQTTGVVGGYTDDMKKKVIELGDQHEVERLKINTVMGQIANAHLNTKNEIVSADGTIIGSLKDVTTTAEGVKTGIVDINGTPMQITTNADGVITDMTTVTDKVKAIPEKKDVTISFFQNGLDTIKKWYDGITNKTVKFALTGLAGTLGENATGTYNYSGGLSTFNEQGWELASNNDVAVLSSNLANIPQGTAIRTHMQSIEDMKSEVSKQINSLMLSGGYYNRDTLQSKQLVNNSNINNNNYNGTEIDYNKLANIMVTAFASGLGNLNMNFEVDADGMVKKAVNTTLDKLNRQSKVTKVYKGR